MGLLDVLNGMQHGPRGPSTPSSQSQGGGMSPMTMAILALLAWKAVKHFSGSQTGAAPQPAPAPRRRMSTAGVPGGGMGGGLGDLLKGGLGGLLAGGAAGSMLERRARRPSQPVPAEGPWRPGQFLGRQRPRTSRSRPAISPARSAPTRSIALAPERIVARRIAARVEPVSAGRDQPSDAGRTVAGRARIVGPAVITGCSQSLAIFRERTEPWAALSGSSSSASSPASSRECFRRARTIRAGSS